jgi:hypothetical protein
MNIKMVAIKIRGTFLVQRLKRNCVNKGDQFQETNRNEEG